MMMTPVISKAIFPTIQFFPGVYFPYTVQTFLSPRLYYPSQVISSNAQLTPSASPFLTEVFHNFALLFYVFSVETCICRQLHPLG